MIHTTFRSQIKKISKWAALGIILTLSFTWLLLAGPFLSPVVKIETQHFPADKSQLFYKNKGNYNEINSAFAKINPDNQSFEFSLSKYDSDLRWDPLETAGEFTVKAVQISVLGYRSVVDLDNITASAQMEKSVLHGLPHFMAPVGSTDPQINIHIKSRHIDKVRLIIAFIIAALAAMATIAWTIWHTAILEYSPREKGLIRTLQTTLIKDEFSLAEFTKLLGIGILLNILPMANFFLSVDDEIGAFRTNPAAWISDGRWTAFLVEKFIFPQPVLPFVPNLFFYVCLAASYMLILRAHNLKFTWITAMAYCIFVAHPIWWFIGEFYSNIPSTGLGILFLSISIYIVSKIDLTTHLNKTYLAQVLTASIFLALTIGTYQSLIMFYLAAGIGTIIFAYKKATLKPSTDTLPILKLIGALATVFFTGLVIYTIINKFVQYLYPTNWGYVDSFLRIDALLADPLLITQLVATEILKIYTGSEDSFGVSFFSSAITISLAVLLLATQKTLKASAWMIIFISGMLVSPFLLHFITGAVYLPLRSMLAVSFINWIAVVVIMEQRGVLRIVGIALTTTLLLQMISINGQYSASTILATTHDRLTAEALYSRMALLDPNFDRNAKTPVDVYGKLSFTSRYPAPATSSMSSSFFEWDDGNVHRMVRYMQLVGFNNLYALDNATRIMLTPKFNGMSTWPAAGSVRLEDGIYYIKLSDKPDPIHAKFK